MCIGWVCLCVCVYRMVCLCVCIGEVCLCVYRRGVFVCV